MKGEVGRVEQALVAPGSGPRGGGDDLADREEHAANVRRFRTFFAMGAPFWPAFLVTDYLIDRFVEPGVLVPFAIIRAVYFPFIVGVPILLWRRPHPSPRALRAMQISVMAGMSICIGLMCALYRGIESPYLHGSAVLIAITGAISASHWRRGAVLAAIAGLTCPAVIVCAAPVLPGVAAQLADATALGIFAQHLLIITGVASVTALGGHVRWALRRQVFESRSIGRYRLERLLAKGGMGEVWAAWHNGLRRSVALKLLRSGDASPGAVARFEREVAALGELTHPNTVRVFDFGVTEDGICYYAMELLEGEDLGSLVAREGPQPAERAVHLVWQAARALAEAHARGTVHRDVKPENLFVTMAGAERDFVKVLDFGIAKREARDATLTHAGWIGGTPAYMSPEAASGKPSDARSDVYSLGLVLYTLLAGRPPFEDDNAASVLYKQIHETPLLLEAWAGVVPEDVNAVLARCLAKRPDERFADAGALAQALAGCECFGRWDASLAPAPGERRAPALDTSAGTLDATAREVAG